MGGAGTATAASQRKRSAGPLVPMREEEGGLFASGRNTVAVRCESCYVALSDHMLVGEDGYQL